MKKILALICLFFVFQSNSQSIDVLENKNGYKSLKINSHKSQHKFNLELIEKKNGYTTYKYVDGYEIVNESIYIDQKIYIWQLANKYKTKSEIIKSLNPNIKIKKRKVKSKQTLIIPVRKKISSYSVDKSMFNLFGEQVNSIYLTFENRSNKLKKISLDLDIKRSPQFLKVLGYNLKQLYTEFENVIGQTTEYPKPSIDCYKFKTQSCIYFEDRIFKGEILWKSKSIVLEIFHDTESKINFNGTVNLMVSRIISFVDKEYYQSTKMNSF